MGALLALGPLHPSLGQGRTTLALQRARAPRSALKHLLFTNDLTATPFPLNPAKPPNSPWQLCYHRDFQLCKKHLQMAAVLDPGSSPFLSFPSGQDSKGTSQNSPTAGSCWMLSTELCSGIVVWSVQITEMGI